jgi:integrase
VVVKGSSAEETTDNGMFKAGKLQKVSYIVQAKRKLVDVRYCENDETIDDSDVDPDYVPGSDESESDNSTWDSAVDAFVSDRKRPKIASSGLGESSVSIRPATTSKQSNKHVLSHHVDSLKPMNVVSKKVSSIRQDCEPGASLTETSKQTVDPEEEADASLDDSSVMLHTEDSINEEVSADKRQRTDRPARPCPFCGQFKVRLTRHLRTVHKKESAVSNCLMQDLSEQRAVYKQLKRSGIMAYNMKVAGQKDINLQRERTCKTQSKAVVCDCCSGVFNRRWFAAHKQKCDAKQGVEPRPINASVVFSSLNVPEEFKTDVLSKFSSDEVGRLCQQDETIIMIGHKLYLKVKARKDKKVQVRRSVMTDMRRLGHLYIHFQTIDQRNANQSAGDCSMSVLDMFRRQNFNVLEEACASYTAADESSGGKNKPDKSGLQLALYYLLIKAAKILKVFYLVKNDNLKSSETAEFLDVLHFSKDSLIGGAIYNTNKNRNTKLRRVDNLPQLEDLSNLKTHMVSRMQQILNDEFLLWTSSIFVEVRDLACARLTLFNARRGGEPARLQVSDWSDACSQVWFDKTRMQAMPPEEKELIEKSYVMYQTGKGVNHLVPVIVPDDTVPALRKLTDATIRSECGVNPENSYLFPSTVASESNVSGWHALKRACIQSGVSSSRITATKMRHLASTMYASLDVPEAKRAAFYSHMGHSKAVNAAIYQTPLAEQEVLEVGAILHRFGRTFKKIAQFYL